MFGSTLHLGDGRFRVSLLWWVAVTALATWALWRTRFGNAVFASGGARKAARQLGVPVRRTSLTLFCLTAAAGWLIGTLGLVRLDGVQVGAPGLGTAVDFIVVAVIGGCLLTGGYGSAVGASIGALLYAVARHGIALAGWDPAWFQAFLGRAPARRAADQRRGAPPAEGGAAVVTEPPTGRRVPELELQRLSVRYGSVHALSPGQRHRARRADHLRARGERFREVHARGGALRADQARRGAAAAGR